MGVCLAPFYKKNESGEWMSLPCSKCPNCKKRRASAWSFRLIKEGEKSISALFVTLTYDTRFVPITKNGFLTLKKSDVQKFMKRLRKISINPLKYYAVGEYGSKTLRPHYHLIIFNADVLDIERSWALDNKKIGEIYVGKVSDASIGYTLKYISKDGKIPMHKNDDRQKEFSLMSKGLGKNYLTANMKNWHLDNLTERCYVPLKDNKKIAMPRYYKDKIYNDIQKSLIADAMKEKSIITEQQLEDELGEMYFKIKMESVQAEYQKMIRKQLNNIDKL